MRRIVSISLILVIILNIGMISGCRGSVDGIMLNEISYVEDTGEWYEYIKIEPDMELLGTRYNGFGGLIFADDYFTCLLVGADDMFYTVRYYIYKYGIDGSIQSVIDISYLFESAYAGIGSIVSSYTDDGHDYIVFEYAESETWVYNYAVYELDYDNQKLIFNGTLDLYDKVCDGARMGDINISGDYYVYTVYDSSQNQMLYTVNVATRESYVTPIDSREHSYFWLTSMGRTGYPWENKIYYCALRENDEACYSFNPETGAFQESSSEINYSNTYVFMPDGSAVYLKDGNVIKCSLETEDEGEIVADMSNSSMSPYCYARQGHIQYYSDNYCVLGMYEFSNSQEYQNHYLYLLYKSPNPNVGRQIVTVAGAEGITNEIGNYIEINNSSNSDYFIEYTDKYNWWNYADYSVSEDEIYNERARAQTQAQDVLMLDIKNGEGPDVLIGFSTVCAFTPQRVYANLLPFVDGENGINRDDYIDVTFAGNSDGGLYQIPFAVTLNGFDTPADLEDVNLDRMTYDQYIDFINKHHDGIELILGDDNVSASAIYDKLNYFFCRLWAYHADEFMEDGSFNITTGENGERFRAMAEFACNLDVEFSVASDKGRFIPASEAGWTSFFYYVCYSNGRVHDVVGYPSYDGMTPSSDSEKNTIAMSICSGDKEAAWSVIKVILGYEMQCTFMDTFIPVNISALEYTCDTTIDCIERGISGRDATWDIHNADLRAWREQFVEDVCSIEELQTEDQRINQILREELPAYLDGQKSIDDVAVIIENRVNTYLHEVG